MENREGDKAIMRNNEIKAVRTGMGYAEEGTAKEC